MGRKFFISGFKGSDPYVDHALQVQQDGVARDGWDQTHARAQVVGSKRRVVQEDAAIGLDTVDVHMGGDPCVVVGEIPDPKTGDITQYVERYDDSRNFIGSYAVRWVKTGNGGHTLAGKRRIFY